MTLGLLVLLKVIRIKIPIDFQHYLSLEAKKIWIWDVTTLGILLHIPKWDEKFKTNLNW